MAAINPQDRADYEAYRKQHPEQISELERLIDRVISRAVASHSVPLADQESVTTGRRMLGEMQVLEIIPISRSTLLRMEKAGTFPRSTYISPNRRVWFEDEIVGWQNAVDEFNPNRGRGKGRRARVSR